MYYTGATPFDELCLIILYLFQAARDLGVDCVVSPYESDAQLAYLVQAGYADIVITEDSDLLMFGCKQVIFKLDMAGAGVLITWSAGIGENCCNIPSQDFTPASLRYMGVLSGCDYFSGIPRIGLATAAKVSVHLCTLNLTYIPKLIFHFCRSCVNAVRTISDTYSQIWGNFAISQTPLVCRPKLVSLWIMMKV